MFYDTDEEYYMVIHRNKYCNHVLTKSFVAELPARQYPFVGLTKSATRVAFYKCFLCPFRISSKGYNQPRNTLRFDNEAVSLQFHSNLY